MRHSSSSRPARIGTLLALRESAKPSVILFRHMPDRSAASLTSILLTNLDAVEADLTTGVKTGAIVAVHDRCVHATLLL